MRRPAPRVAVLGLALLGMMFAAEAAEPPPAKGRFLVAAREMIDPNFSESVILLLSHGDGGTMGLIVNRPTVVLPEQAIPDIAGLRDYSGPLFLGGPVQLNAVTFLIRGAPELDGGERVLPGVQYAADAGLLEELTTEPIDAATLRVFVGYAGWAPGQLEGEIARGGWHVLPADADTVFAEDPSAVWERLLPLPEPLSASARPMPGSRRGRPALARRSAGPGPGRTDEPGPGRISGRPGTRGDNGRRGTILGVAALPPPFRRAPANDAR